jgi:hypothetical protein
MTGSSTEGIPAATNDLQVQAVLQKPFRPEELISLVNTLPVSRNTTTNASIDPVKR